MKLFRVSNTALVLFILLISAAGAFAQQGNGPQPPPPAGAGLCTDGLYLFVMAGDTMYQYTSAELSLLATVVLPKPAPPSESDTQAQASTCMARWAEKFKTSKDTVSSDNQTQPPPAGSGLSTDGT
jgi:hypothetical protein